MDIKIFRCLWGMELPTLEENFKKIVDGGFDGVEMAAPPDPRERENARKLLDDLKLARCCGIWTRFDLKTGDWFTPRPEEAHIQSFKDQFDISLDLNPSVMVCQAGKDYAPFEENLRIIQACEDYSKEKGVKTVQETHRGSFSFAPSITRPFLQKLPWLRLNADFSNWCASGESLLQGQEDDVALAISRADHIHGRLEIWIRKRNQLILNG